jgi:hypothetical protein
MAAASVSSGRARVTKIERVLPEIAAVMISRYGVVSDRHVAFTT